MAGQFFPQPDSIGSTFAHMQRQLESLATTPSAGNQSIVDGALVVIGSNGYAETLIGQYTWPTAPWAGVKIYGVVTFDATGTHPICVVGLQPDGKYGFALYDTAGVRAMYLGDQGSGSYGLAVRNHTTGIMQQVAGVLSATGTTLSNYTSFTPVSLACSVSADIGPSGLALVTASVAITNNTPTDSGIVMTYVNTVYNGTGPSIFSNPGLTVGASTFSQFTQGASTSICNCGSGTKTFDLYAKGSGGTGSTFQFINLVVQPL